MSTTTLGHILERLPSAMLPVAHRGYSARYPENTLLAQRQALRIGCLIIEADVRRTADGIFFSHHDETLERLSGHPLAPSDLTWRQICELLPHRPALTADSLDLVRDRDALLLLDVKFTGSRDLRDLARLIEHKLATGHVIVGVRHLDHMATLRAANPELTFLGLLDRATEQAEAFFAQGGDVLRLWQEDVDVNGVPAICRDGKPFWITAGDSHGENVGVTDADYLNRCLDYGAGAVLVNDPTLFLTVDEQEI